MKPRNGNTNGRTGQGAHAVTPKITWICTPGNAVAWRRESDLGYQVWLPDYWQACIGPRAG